MSEIIKVGKFSDRYTYLLTSDGRYSLIESLASGALRSSWAGLCAGKQARTASIPSRGAG